MGSSQAGAGGAGAVGAVPQAWSWLCSAFGVFLRLPFKPGIWMEPGQRVSLASQRAPKILACALSAVRGGLWARQGAKATVCPIARLSGSIAAAKKIDLDIYIHT